MYLPSKNDVIREKENPKEFGDVIASNGKIQRRIETPIIHAKTLYLKVKI